eukprot:13737591-Alexandrium_andersonii.AAC.1
MRRIARHSLRRLRTGPTRKGPEQPTCSEKRPSPSSLAQLCSKPGPALSFGFELNSVANN